MPLNQYILFFKPIGFFWFNILYIIIIIIIIIIVFQISIHKIYIHYLYIIIIAFKSWNIYLV